MKKVTYIILSICLIMSLTVSAQFGALDTTFSLDGKVTTSIGNFGEEAHSVAIQGDGKIVVVGSSWNGSDTDFVLVRYNIDGSLDSTFSSDGKVVTDIQGYSDEATSVLIQNDGKIVVGGWSLSFTAYYYFTLVRYNTNGTLDNTFDVDGKVITAFSSTSCDLIYSIDIQNDNKIVAAGVKYGKFGGTSEIALARYNANGSLDTTFGSSGVLTTSVGIYGTSAASIKIQSDGKIVVGGTAAGAFLGKTDVALVRYNTNGSLDNTFDFDGMLTTDLGSIYDYGESIAIQSDGKIILAGFTINGSDADIALVRYNTNGSLDNTFDFDGKVISHFGSGKNECYSVAIQSDGKIVAVGNTYNGADNDFVLIRYNSNGSIDTSFYSDGIISTFLGNKNDYAKSVAIQSNGNIVVAGYSFIGSNNDFAVARYNISGACSAKYFSQNISINQGDSIKIGFHIYKIAGTYIDTLSASNSCDSIITTNLSVLTGISDYSTYLQFTIYPNPFTSQTTIALNEDYKKATIKIIDVIGKEVKSINFSGKQYILERDDLKTGMYFIQVISENKIIATNKILID